MLFLALLSALLLVLEFTVTLSEVEVQVLDLVDLFIALVFLGVMITAPAVAHAEEIAEKKEHA